MVRRRASRSDAEQEPTDEWEEEAEYEDEYEEEEEDDGSDDEEWEYEDEEDDDEEWAPAGWDEDRDGVVTAAEVRRTVSFGFVSMLPLLVAYEWAYYAVSERVEGGPRSVAEAMLSAPLIPFGDESTHLIRRCGIALLAIVTLVVSLRREWALGPRMIRILIEGVVVAVLLGPVLAVATTFTEPYVGAMVVGSSEGVPPLTRAALVMGGAAYEEIVFRVLGLALAFVAARQFFRFFGVRGRFGSLLAAISAAAVSSVVFALFHLQGVTAWLGPGGEEFDAAVFTWRCLAGILLAGTVVWRGVGVAAWAHALFNLALLIGVHPPTFH